MDYKERIEFIKSIEWRTRAMPWTLAFFCVIAVSSFGALLVRAESVKKVPPPKITTAFDNVTLSAKAAYVWDTEKEEALFEKNANEPLPLASLTKVMTALTAEEFAGSLNQVVITPENLSAQGDSGLMPYSKWKLNDLIDYSLVVSSNDGASAIAAAAGAFIDNTNLVNTNQDSDKEVFIKKMNEEASLIGLENYKFLNEHGLDEDSEHVGAYASARDMAKLFEYILRKHPKLLEATRYANITIKDQDGIVYQAANTNLAANEIPSLIASKTGYTDLAGGNLVIAYDAGLGHPVIISVLGSTLEGRFEDALKLLEASRQYIHDN